MGDPWGIRGFRGVGDRSPILGKSSKKSAKNLKNQRNREKIGKIGFYFTENAENGLKFIRMPTKHL